VKNQKRVEYLVEVCDPSEAAPFGYTVNDVPVSDFYTPSYFDPVFAPGVRYSFTGAIKKPRQVLRGGYVSWHNPVDDHWYQLTWFSGSKPRLRDLGVFSASSRSTREMIDIATKTPRNTGKVKLKSAFQALTASAGAIPSSAGKAHYLELEIATLLANKLVG